MNRKKCYCSNKFCKCLFGCGCTVYGINDPSAKASNSGYGKCMCCIMEENDKKLRRRGGNVTIEKTKVIYQGECKCDDKYKTKFYDIIVFNIVGDEEYYWSCRYGCMVTITEESFDPDNVEWENGTVENVHKSKIQITYDITSIQSSSEEVNILIVKEENLNHVWCQVNSISTK